MRRAFGSVLIASVLLSLLTLSGQGKPEPKRGLILPDSLTEAPTKTLVRIPKGETEGIPWKVWVGVDSYRPLRAPRQRKPDDDDAYMPGKPMKFMEPCFVAHKHQGKDTSYLLLARADGSGKKVDELLGWIDERWVVPDPVAKANEATSIYRKVMIVNTPESVTAGLQLFTFDQDIKADLDARKLPDGLRKKFTSVGVQFSANTTIQETGDSSRWTIADAGDKEKSQPPQQFEVQKKGSSYIVSDGFAQAGVFDAPLATARRRTALKLFNILFIYAETPEYVLVGTQPALRADLDVVKGWIPKHRLAFWDTREGFEWDRETSLKKKRQPGVVLGSPHDAYQWEEDKPPEKKLFQEKFDKSGATRVYAYNDPRFLKLKWDGDDKHPPVHENGNRLYLVGAAGGLPGMSEKGEGDFKDLLAKIEQSEKSLGTLELVFVIDDSQSMKKYFEKIGLAVEQVLKASAAQAIKNPNLERTLKVAISYYSDDPTPEPVRPARLQTIIRPKTSAADIMAQIKKVCDEVKKHKYTYGGDEPEMVFEGVKQAIDKAGFSDSARKAVVLVGDAPDITVDPKRAEKLKKKLKRDVTVDSEMKRIVAKLFPTGRTPIEFYAIQMEETDRPGAPRQETAVQFQQQMEALVKQVNTQSKPVNLAGFAHASNTDELGERIRSRYAEIERQTRKWRDELNRLRSGEFHTEVSAGLLLHLKSVRIDVDKLKKFKGAQLFQEGYVWQYAPGGGKVQQLRPVVLLDGPDVEMIVNLLEEIAGKKARLIRDVGSLKKLHVKLVEGLTGDSNLSIAEAVARKRGLKFTSPILNKNPKNINKVFPDSELAPLKLKLARLKDLLKDEEQEYKWETEKEKSGQEYKEPVGKKGTLKKRRRYYTLPGDNVRWYWVDVEREIP